jgi:hypothetical protein
MLILLVEISFHRINLPYKNKKPILCEADLETGAADADDVLDSGT